MHDASSEADSNAGFPHKRAIRRFALQLPVTITAKSGKTMQVTAESRDVSSHGICFFCDSALEPESAIEFTLTLPAEVTMSEPLVVRCSGKVVRVERQPKNRFAVAVAITNYEFLSDRDEEVPTVADRPRAM